MISLERLRRPLACVQTLRLVEESLPPGSQSVQKRVGTSVVSRAEEGEFVMMPQGVITSWDSRLPARPEAVGSQPAVPCANTVPE